MRFEKATLAVASAAIGAFVASVAVPIAMANGDSGETFWACEKDGSLTPGSLTVGETPPSCSGGAELISWNQIGPQGPIGLQGAKGDPGPQGAPGETASGAVVYDDYFDEPLEITTDGQVVLTVTIRASTAGWIHSQGYDTGPTTGGEQTYMSCRSDLDPNPSNFRSRRMEAGETRTVSVVCYGLPIGSMIEYGAMTVTFIPSAP